VTIRLRNGNGRCLSWRQTRCRSRGSRRKDTLPSRADRRVERIGCSDGRGVRDDDRPGVSEVRQVGPTAGELFIPEPRADQAEPFHSAMQLVFVTPSAELNNPPA